MDIESTRKKFEENVYDLDNRYGYRYKNLLLERDETESYYTTWVDSAWLGWCAAIKEYNLTDEQKTPA